MEEFETKKLVRIYSFHAEERLAGTENGQVLGQVLSKEEQSLEDILAPWRLFYEPWESDDPERSPITAILSVEASKLQKQWHIFRRTSPKDEQVNTKELAPSISCAIQVITDMSHVWEAKRWIGKRGKAKSYFHRLCNTLDAHNNILGIVPRGNEYVSLLAGTLTTIIKASVNHEAIAEDITQALGEIGEVVADCHLDLKLFRTEDVQRAVADLYAHIFLFLNDTLCWYAKTRRKRLLDSFNEKFRDTFDESVENIRRKAGVIKRKAVQGNSAEQRVTRLLLEDLKRDLRVGLEGGRREKAEMQYLALQMQDHMASQKAEWSKQDIRWENLRGALNLLLNEAAGLYTVQGNASKLIQEQNQANMAMDHRSSDSSKPCIMEKEDLLLHSAGLEEFFHRDRIRLASLDPSFVMADSEALAQVSEWTKSSAHQILAIAGQEFEGYELENPTTILAAKFIDFATASKVPTISYFCQLRRYEKLIGDNTKELQGLIQMVYALVRQMIELLLPEVHTDENFRLGQFSQLDGTAGTWDDAISVFNGVQNLLPGMVFCVVDGMQWLDSRRINKYMTQFVQVLRGGKLKVLLTTAGEARSLSSSLRPSELLILEGRDLRSHRLWTFEEAHLTL